MGQAPAQRRVRSKSAPAPFAFVRSYRFSGRLPPLPAELNSFVGRELELRQLGELLSQTRLLTLTGVGGVGKTRLALRLATQIRTGFADGVILVELAPVTDTRFVPHTLAAVLGVELQAGQEVMAQLVDVLREAHALLVLDNCEHLVAACAEMVETLLRSCAHLVVLAVSREPLGISGETTWRVPPLSVPERAVPLTAAHLVQFEAVRLFVDRARAALPAFVLSGEKAPAIARVCTALGGIPLALELAAPRVRVLSVQQLADRLDDALQFLGGGSRTAPVRQQTLRATLDWSYQLLSRPEQRMFDRVSIFVGGWSLEAAEAIATGDDLNKSDVLDVLAGLVDKSLVLAEPGEDAQLRYRLLETLRQYGQEHLATAGQAEDVSSRHADYFMELGERAIPHMVGDQHTELWFKRFAAERGNLRAAMHHFTDRGDDESGLRLGGAVWRFWHVRGTFTEGRDWLALLLQATAGSTHSAARAIALNGAGCLAGQQGDYKAAQCLLEESQAIWHELNNPVGVATCLNNLAGVARERGDYAGACQFYEQVLSFMEAHQDSARLAITLNSLAWVLAEQGEYERARALSARSVELSRELGDEAGTARNTLNLAWCVLQSGDPMTARDLLSRNLDYFSDGEPPTGIVACLHGLAAVAARTAHYTRAIRLAAAAAQLQRTLRQPFESHAHSRRVASWLEPLRQAVDPHTLTSAWAQGEALSLEETIAYARAADDAPFSSIVRESPVQNAPPPFPLTPREYEVASLLAHGRSNRDIAAALVIATSTVERHVANILNKLSLGSRTEVAVWAVVNGLGSPPEDSVSVGPRRTKGEIRVDSS